LELGQPIDGGAGVAKRILAVAVAEHSDEIEIKSWKGLKGLRGVRVRPYIRGLVQGLDEFNAQLGQDYVITFRQRDASNLAGAFTNPSADPMVVVCMSTTVVKAAASAFPPGTGQPIVGMVSEPTAEGVGTTANTCGVNAKRSQSADNCFKRFMRTVPTLTEVRVLHKANYGPSVRALSNVTTAAGNMNPPVTITPVTVTTAAQLKTELQNANLPQRDPDTQPATVGVQVLPVDVCLGNAQEIIDFVQGEKGLPVFFPVPDWVRPDATGALGAYGVPQRRCGMMMAEQVKAIWDNNNTVPNFAAVNERWIPAPKTAFEFLASGPVADELNIKLKANIPRA
jgi:ABC-type uncharacterized transport system substrate-binding protein